VSLIPSLTEGLAGLGTTVCIKLLSRMNKPTGLWVGGPQRNEISDAARSSAPPASTCHVQRRRRAPRQEPPIGLGGSWNKPVVVFLSGARLR
jgi:hypothetical protein